MGNLMIKSSTLLQSLGNSDLEIQPWNWIMCTWVIYLVERETFTRNCFKSSLASLTFNSPLFMIISFLQTCMLSSHRNSYTPILVLIRRALPSKLFVRSFLVGTKYFMNSESNLGNTYCPFVNKFFVLTKV